MEKFLCPVAWVGNSLPVILQGCQHAVQLIVVCVCWGKQLCLTEELIHKVNHKFLGYLLIRCVHICNFDGDQNLQFTFLPTIIGLWIWLLSLIFQICASFLKLEGSTLAILFTTRVFTAEYLHLLFLLMQTVEQEKYLLMTWSKQTCHIFMLLEMYCRTGWNSHQWQSRQEDC